MSQSQPSRPEPPAIRRQGAGSDASRNVILDYMLEHQRRADADAAAEQEEAVAAGHRVVEFMNEALNDRRRRLSEPPSNPILRYMEQHRHQRHRRPTMTVINERGVYSVEPFDIRPALLETASRDNADSYDRWCTANSTIYQNELCLADFLVTNIGSKLAPMSSPDVDLTILDIFDESMRSKGSYKSLDNMLKIAGNRAKVDRTRLNDLVHEFCTARGVPADDLIDSQSEYTTIESTKDLRRHLLAMGATSPFIKFKACSSGHLWPEDADAPSTGDCCRGAEPCIYFSRILFLQSLFRSSTFGKFLHEELDRQRDIAGSPNSVIHDWTDGDFFNTVYSPFMSACANDDFPLALSSMIDGADLLSWGSKSVVPLVQIVMGLPASIRCNQGLISPVALIPNVAKGHRRAIQRLDAFELNLMYFYGFPVFDAVSGRIRNVRCISAVMAMDYVELCATSCTSQNGKRDACNQCGIRGRSAHRSVKYHGAFMFASPEVQGRFNCVYEAMVKSLDSLPTDKRPRDVRSLNQLQDDVRLKNDDDIRRRMTSGNLEDRGGFRDPGYDVYSVGLLSNFGHRTNYVHDPMHAVCLRVIRSLFKAIDFYGSGTPLYNLEAEKLFGRDSDPVPVWAWPNNSTFPAKVKSGVKWSSLAVELESVLKKLTWISGGPAKPKNPLVSSWWKASDSLVWLGDVGICLWWSVVGKVLLRSHPDSAVVSFWMAIFQFLHTVSSMLSKAFVKSDLDRLSKTFRDALAYLESVIPSSLWTISMHSLVHLPDIIKRWGPLLGCVWTWPMERWILFMKEVLQSTISETIAIALYLQLVQAATFLRGEFYQKYSLRSDSPLLYGNNIRMDVLHDYHVSTLRIDLRYPLSTVDLDEVMRCWLHVHLFSMMHWPSTANHSWRMRYRRLVRDFAAATNSRNIGTFDGMRRQLRNFDVYFEYHKSTYSPVCLPKTLDAGSRADIGNCMFRTQDADSSYKTCNSKFIVDFEGAGLYMGGIRHLVKFDLSWPLRLAQEADSMCLIVVDRWYQLLANDKPYERALPRFYLRNGYKPGMQDSMWQAMQEIVPNNVVTIPVPVLHQNAIENATMVCLEPRGNMTGTTLQTTIVQDGAAII